MTTWTREILGDSGQTTTTLTPSTSWTAEVVDLDVSGASLTIDSIRIDDNRIGHVDDRDLLTFAENSLTVAGGLTMSGGLTTDKIIVNSGIFSDASTNVMTFDDEDVTFPGDVIIGTDVDDYDRSITFGHGTLKSIIGIDDSQDKFVINTDGAFETTNDLEIDDSGNVIIGNGDLHVAGSLTMAGPIISISSGTIMSFQGNDAAFADNIVLGTDSSIIYFGASTDVNLTHTFREGLSLGVTSSQITGFIDALKINHQSLNEPDELYGTSILYQLENDGGLVKDAGRLLIRWTDAKDGANDAGFFLRLMNNGSAPGNVFTVESDGNTRVHGAFACMGHSPDTDLHPSYTVTNEAEDRTYNANGTNVEELADVLGTLINDLTNIGLLS